MLEFSGPGLCEGIAHSSLAPLHSALLRATNEALIRRKHGNIPKWCDVVNQLPSISPSSLNLNNHAVTVGSTSDVSEFQQTAIRSGLMALHPWRKGPFDIFGVHVDSEWRSDMKWSRLEMCLESFQGKRILDIGCGNGYYLLRMLGAGADCVLGIDPTRLFVVQFHALKKFLPNHDGFVLPLRSEDLPFEEIEFTDTKFDVVFSMGVLYHRKDGIGHLEEARKCLKTGGSLVLETLMMPGEEDAELVPESRYAQMRNVWSIPTASRLLKQLEAAGFKDGEIIDISRTTINEQRQTPWMTFNSLSDFLDPNDHNKTIEGYPAPTRIMVRCKA